MIKFTNIQHKHCIQRHKNLLNSSIKKSTCICSLWYLGFRSTVFWVFWQTLFNRPKLHYQYHGSMPKATVSGSLQIFLRYTQYWNKLWHEIISHFRSQAAELYTNKQNHKRQLSDRRQFSAFSPFGIPPVRHNAQCCSAFRPYCAVFTVRHSARSAFRHAPVAAAAAAAAAVVVVVLHHNTLYILSVLS